MYQPDRFPNQRVDSGSQQQPHYGRHHSVRYYAHRVKESLTTRVFKFICTVFLFIFFVVGLIAFILWLSLRPHRPRFYIEEFSVPALAQPNAPPGVAVLQFNVTIRNSNQKVIVHYDSIDCAVYYRDQPIGGSPLFTEAFDQGSKNTMVISKELSGPTFSVNNEHWMEMMKDRTAGSVTFRLEITSTIKFEIFDKWDTRRHKMHASCPAVVGSDGLLLPGNRHKRCRVYFT